MASSSTDEVGAPLAGRVALVTGAASGLGAGCASAFAAAGAHLVLLDRDADALNELAAAHVDSGTEIVALPCDVRSEEDIQAAVRGALGRFGRLDVALVNAGIAGEGSALDVPRAVWDDVLAVNLTGAWLTARCVLPPMIESGAGSIIFQSSVTALVGRPRIAAYAAAKGGLVALTRQLAADVSASGVRVNALCPGTIITEMAMTAFRARGYDVDGREGGGSLRAIASQHPLGRLGTAADVAAAALFLASDASSWITGVALPVDGGITAVGRDLVPTTWESSVIPHDKY